MSRRIVTYELDPQAALVSAPHALLFVVRCWKGAKVLGIQTRSYGLALPLVHFFVEDDEREQAQQALTAFATDQVIPLTTFDDRLSVGEYVGTFQHRERVWHVFHSEPSKPFFPF